MLFAFCQDLCSNLITRATQFCRSNLKKLPKIALTKKSSRKRHFIPKTANYVLKTATFFPKRHFLSQTGKFCPNDEKLPIIALTKILPLTRRFILKTAVYIPKTVTFVPNGTFCPNDEKSPKAHKHWLFPNILVNGTKWSAPMKMFPRTSKMHGRLQHYE